MIRIVPAVLRARPLVWALGAAIVLAPGSAEAQDSCSPCFAFGFASCPSRLEAPVGGLLEAELGLTLTTSVNPAPNDGAQGWSLSITSDGVGITSITVAGTLAADETDDPPGLRRNGFKVCELSLATSRNSGECVGRLGAVSAVVLSMTEPVTLPPEGEALIARITVEGAGPPTVGDSYAARVFYLDGCAGKG